MIAKQFNLRRADLAFANAAKPNLSVGVPYFKYNTTHPPKYQQSCRLAVLCHIILAIVIPNTNSNSLDQHDRVSYCDFFSFFVETILLGTLQSLCNFLVLFEYIGENQSLRLSLLALVIF